MEQLRSASSEAVSGRMEEHHLHGDGRGDLSSEILEKEKTLESDKLELRRC